MDQDKIAAFLDDYKALVLKHGLVLDVGWSVSDEFGIVVDEPFVPPGSTGDQAAKEEVESIIKNTEHTKRRHDEFIKNRDYYRSGGAETKP